MGEAPERIWAWEGDEQDGWDNAYASILHVSKGQTEYIRSDTHQAEIDAVTVRLTAMTENAERLAKFMDLLNGSFGGGMVITFSAIDVQEVETALAAHRKLMEQQK